MKCVLVIVIVTLTKCVLSEEDTPQIASSPPQYYQLENKPGSTIVCVEVTHGPYKSGVTKICGPPVNAVQTSSGSQTSSSRSADHMMLPEDTYVTFPLPMLRQADERATSGAGCIMDKPYNGRFEPGMVHYAPNYAASIPFIHTYPSAPRMAMEVPKDPIFGVDQVMMEKSTGCSADLTSESMRAMPPFQNRFTPFSGKEPINPWLSVNAPIVNPLPMSRTVQLPPASPPNAGRSLYPSNGRTPTSSQDMTIEKLKKECEEKDKELAEKKIKIEDLQKELALKRTEEPAKVVTSSMAEQKVKRNESPNITQIERKN